ncbi:NAD(P)-dependent oxidoreductase [uncultured Duncaniella sp.]|jgi:phosphoglycerate dehydrogenase-like enzyme|uniref:NAD(P)-dependent oxidoreductase n=1 Tax=uncultured Duncaniella sp. TaxID=2768039 RepID=UPI0026F3C0AA|nr:NAD(P)-dependent oxidoreductase [uncultured Duncaniella sp.]
MILLISGAFKYSEAQKKAIEGMGYSIVDMPQEKDPLPVDASSIDAVICNGLFLHHKIADFTNLQFIQLTSAGLDRVPLDYINSHNIKLYNARGVYSIPMAEWTMLRILERYKFLGHFNDCQKTREWNKLRTLRELSGEKVAIIGAGNVGSEIARRLSAFGTKITGYDLRESNIPYFDEVRLISRFKEDVPDFDIIILTAPLTDQTRNMIDAMALESMKDNAMIVNVSRGGLIDEDALAYTLREHPQMNAALDVFNVEPLPKESALWDLDNVKLSPHNSFVSNKNQNRLFDVIYNNLLNHAQ